MPIEFQVPSLQWQTMEQLPEAESEQKRLEQLFELEEERINCMCKLEQEPSR